VPRFPQSRHGVYFAAVPELLAKGYVPIALIPSTKRPFQKEWGAVYGEGSFPTPEVLIERLRSYMPPTAWDSDLANPALIKEKGSIAELPWDVGLVARDGVAFIDVDDPDEVAAIEVITGLHQGNTTVKFGNKGLTYFFKLPALPEGSNARSYNQRIRNKMDLLTWHAQTVVPPSIHGKTGRAYRWGPLGLLPANRLPEVSKDRLDALLVRYGRRPKTWSAQQPPPEIEIERPAELNDLEPDAPLGPKVAKALQMRVDTILEAMRQQGSTRLIGRNRNGTDWGLSIVNDEWRYLVASVVDFAGGNWQAAEPFLDALSRGAGLPLPERTKVKHVYDRARNRSKMACR